MIANLFSADICVYLVDLTSKCSTCHNDDRTKCLTFQINDGRFTLFHTKKVIIEDFKFTQFMHLKGWQDSGVHGQQDSRINCILIALLVM